MATDGCVALKTTFVGAISLTMAKSCAALAKGRTTSGNVQLVVFPDPSTAVQVMVFVPSGKVEPEGGT